MEIIGILKWYVPTSVFLKRSLVQNEIYDELYAILLELVMDFDDFDLKYSFLKKNWRSQLLIESRSKKILIDYPEELSELLMSQYYSSPFNGIRIEKVRSALSFSLNETEAFTRQQHIELVQAFKKLFDLFISEMEQ